MSISPSFALQESIFSALNGASAVTAIVGDRIYDRIPLNPTYPLIHIGDNQMIGEIFQYSGTTEAHANIHVFSRYEGKAELMQIEATVRDALETDIVVNGFTTDYFLYVTSRFMTDPDLLTEHAVLEFKYSLTA